MFAKKALKNNFLNVWNELRNTYLLDKGKLNTYFKYITSFNLENYLIVKNLKNSHILIKFRLSNHVLRIETGRHECKLNLVSGKLELLPRCERLCQHCTSNSIEDERHFTLECSLYQKQRKTILDNLYIKFPNLYNLDHPNLFIWMISNDDPVFFLSAFIEYLDNNFLSRKEKKII